MGAAWLSCAVLILWAVACGAASAQGLAQSVRERLLQPEVLRGEFEQHKQVQGFAKPLISRGSFVVARARGVLWHTRTPFESQLRLTRDEIVATQGGAVAFRLDAAREPAVRVINGLMFALLNGELAALGEHFSIEGSVQGRGWQLQLTPRQPALATLMSRVELAGEQHVRSIRIDEANGDSTVIRFSKQAGEPPRLTAQEAARFD